MLDSVRARLAVWHTAVLAALLSGFALSAYIFLASTSARGASEYLASAASGFVLGLQAERREAASDSAAILASAAEFNVRDLGVVVFDSRGRRIAASAAALVGGVSHAPGARRSSDEAGPPIDTTRLRTLVLRPANTEGRIVALTDAEGGYRVSVTRVLLNRESYTVVVIQSRDIEAETLQNARIACLVAIPIVLVAAGAAGSFLAKRSLAPVAAMTERAARISAANLSERLPVGNPRDELGQLARVLNELLSRVDHSFEQQRRFMSDASHELRTPVSIMRAEAEVALSSDVRSGEEYRESLSVVANTAARLTLVVNELFFLARADAGQQPLARGPMYLDEMIGDCVRSVRALALRSGVAITAVVAGEVPFNGDDGLLHRLVTNLLDNAVKYSGDGATVTASLLETVDGYRIGVRDNGSGIPIEAQPHLFERFFRGDAARSRAVSGDGSIGSGAGLGLAIARWVAQAHGGSIDLTESTAFGTEFVVWLPRDVSAPVAAVGMLCEPGDA